MLREIPFFNVVILLREEQSTGVVRRARWTAGARARLEFSQEKGNPVPSLIQPLGEALIASGTEHRSPPVTRDPA